MSYFFNKNLLFESFCKKSKIDGKIITAHIANCKLDLKVASLPKTQSQGYMHTNNPPLKNEGILFVYDYPQPLSFWMKNVKFNLDIIFFNSNLDYIKHDTMYTCNNMSDSSIPRYSCNNAQYAVELCEGWFEKNGNNSCKLSF